jgi:hypothetical protein
MQAKTHGLIGHAPSEGVGAKSVRFSGSRSWRLFVLSPANVRSVRGNLLFRESGQSALWQRLRNGRVPVGEVFSFISGLYFRGKLAYARAFANAPAGIPGIVLITSSAGLVSPDQLVTLEDLREMAMGRVDASDSGYRIPLESDARLLCEHMGSHCEVVLLGSIATPKYTEPLLSVFGERLMFPGEFVGRGDMSRGGLLLRCVREQTELAYVPVLGASLRGARPSRLPKPARRSASTVRRSRP